MRGDLEHETKRKLLAAASALFAERGFHGTKARDIAARAGVNLAASNYHFGSKKALYLAVLRLQFATTRALLARRGAAVSIPALARLSRPQLIALLQARLQVMLELLIGPPVGVHSQLLVREMAEPTEALSVIVDEFLGPVARDMQAIVAHLAPQLDRAAVERCAFSIAGQAHFYRSLMPAILHMWQVEGYRRNLARRLAAHITEFSLGGMDRLAATGKKRAR